MGQIDAEVRYGLVVEILQRAERLKDIELGRAAVDAGDAAPEVHG
jgi:hypothetical protein